MATIADHFLADFDEESEAEEEEQQAGQEQKEKAGAGGDDADADDVEVKEIGDDDEEIDEDAMDEEEKAPKDASLGAKEGTGRASTENSVQQLPPVEHITTILRDPGLLEHMRQVDELSQRVIDYGADAMDESTATPLAVARLHEYSIIVRCTEYTSRIDDATLLLHKHCCDLFSTRFKELEQIVPMPVEYARVVRKIGNQSDLTLVDLSDILPQHTVLTITVTASTSQGRPLPPEELEQLMGVCDAIIQLDDMRRRLYQFVESRMEIIAPNLSALVGSSAAARLMGVAGGLEALSNIPSCNIQVLGASRQHAAGFSNMAVQPHMGLLAHTDLVIRCPVELRRKALRVVAAKCALCARVDSFQKDQSGSLGRRLREEVQAKMEKWQEPPPPKPKRALPAPDDKPRKRRGGRRYRKQREFTRTTELQKQKNRVMFGQPEEVDEYTGEGFGLLGQATGRLRIQGKTKARVTAKLRQQQQQQQTRTKARRVKRLGGETTISYSGIASSIAFTPVQGMELVNPDAAREQAAEANQKYFSSTASFVRVKDEKKPDQKPPVPRFHG